MDARYTHSKHRYEKNQLVMLIKRDLFHLQCRNRCTKSLRCNYDQQSCNKSVGVTEQDLEITGARKTAKSLSIKNNSSIVSDIIRKVFNSA